MGHRNGTIHKQSALTQIGSAASRPASTATSPSRLHELSLRRAPEGYFALLWGQKCILSKWSKRNAAQAQRLCDRLPQKI